MIAVRGIAVRLDEDDLKYCAQIGGMRTRANLRRGSKDIKSYDQKRFHLTNEQNNTLGVVAEVALLGLGHLDPTEPNVWTAYVSPEEKNYYELIHQPDVLGTFEVRHVNKEDGLLAVRKKVGELVVLDPVITGWMPAREAWEIGSQPEWSDGTDRVVPIHLTRHPNRLKAEIERVEAYLNEFHRIVGA